LNWIDDALAIVLVLLWLWLLDAGAALEVLELIVGVLLGLTVELP